MPWQEVSLVSARREFVMLAMADGAVIRPLCRRFRISPKTGYKWIARYVQAVGGGPELPSPQGGEALDTTFRDRSRRPHRSPNRTEPAMEAAVLAVRQAHPAWGGRKIEAWLRAQGVGGLPSPSTITAILRRHGRIDAAESAKHRPWQRFEAERPNELWQMDFMGDFALDEGRCHPLTVLDDHSRYAIGLQACANQQRTTVQRHMTAMFAQYGLPERILADHGAPWGGCGHGVYSVLAVWLMRLGIELIHGRPRHPQTQGKDERFHRTLNAEVLTGRTLRNLPHCQGEFDRWREVYNFERPHEALGLVPPVSRYQISPRTLPRTLPPIEYGPDDAVRRVSDKGTLSYAGRRFRVGKVFRGQPVALRWTGQDGVLDVYFCRQRVRRLNQRRVRDGAGPTEA